MTKLLKKELKLGASKLSYYFIAFALMTLLPGYPILMGAFFVSFGVFQSFQFGREANDIVYSALLPVAKKDVVKGKYIFAMFIELCGFVLMAVLTVLRMTVLKDAVVYTSNALMNANLVYLGFALLIFGCFNAVFIGGFFKTAYNFGKPFIGFIIAAMLTIGVAETLHHIPGLENLNAFGFEHMEVQLPAFLLGAALFAGLTLFSERKSIRKFEEIDL